MTVTIRSADTDIDCVSCPLHFLWVKASILLNVKCIHHIHATPQFISQSTHSLHFIYIWIFQRLIFLLKCSIYLFGQLVGVIFLRPQVSRANEPDTTMSTFHLCIIISFHINVTSSALWKSNLQPTWLE